MATASIAEVRSRWGIAGCRSSTSPAAPSRCRNEDGTIWVTYNGELYNELELAARARGEGASLPHRRRDTESLVHLYEEEGRRFRCDGSTACSRWRSGTSRGHGLCWHATGWARSRSITRCSPAAAWPSDPSPRRCWPIPRSAAGSIRASLARYLFYEYVPAPISIWESLRKLPAAHALIWENGHGPTATRYWNAAGRRRSTPSTTSTRRPRPSGANFADSVARHRRLGRAARRVPLGRRGFVERGRGALRDRAGAERPHVLDRIRGPELRREPPCSRGRALISGPTITSRPSRSRRSTSSCPRSPPGSMSRSATRRSCRRTC